MGERAKCRIEDSMRRGALNSNERRAQLEKIEQHRDEEQRGEERAGIIVRSDVAPRSSLASDDNRGVFDRGSSEFAAISCRATGLDAIGLM
jgi:hypothetical protein